MIWNSKTLSKALGITIPDSVTANEIQFNSQDVKKGDLFIALQGNRDGHDYVQDAINNGAAAVIISKETNDVDKIILVPDCFKALEQLAIYKRENSKAKFIAITGSVGKTSTKEALKTLLQRDALIFASRGNFNNYLGLLINLASMPDDIEFAIFELGMNHKGEIRELVKILKPNIAMITNISEAHLEFFNSLEDIARAKCEIFENFDKDGIAVINADTNCYDKILSILENLSVNNIYNFGKSVKTSAELILYENLGTQVHLKYDVNKRIMDVNLPFIPKHFAENYAGVLLIIYLLNKDISKAADYLADIPITKGRGQIINIDNSRVICDYYNANPESMKASLRYLKQLDAENKTAIIGEMLELGENLERLHKELVPFIIDSGCSKVLLVGINTKYIYDLLPAKIDKSYFQNIDELLIQVKDLFKNDELILIKGSRGVKLDKIIDYYSKVN